MTDKQYVSALVALCDARQSEQITEAEWRTRLAEVRDSRIEHRRQEQEVRR